MTRKEARPDRVRSAASRRHVLVGDAIIGLFVLIIFAVVLQASVAGAFRSTRPQVALSLVPADAQARARLAVSLAENADSTAARQHAAHLARDALRRDPIMPAALRALAMTTAAGEAAQGEQALAIALMAERLSRRDQGTQVWLIDHFLREGRADEAMGHFDIAFRTSSSSQQALFPLLTSTLEEPRLLEALSSRLEAEPNWAFSFMAYLVDHDSSPALSTRLVQDFLDPSRPDELSLIKTHLERLAGSREYQLAWDTYVHFGMAGEGMPGALGNGGFDEPAGTLPFAWWFADEPDLWANPQRLAEGGNVLQLAALSGRTGVVARQLVRLSPGRYRARAVFGNSPADPFERPEFRIECADEGGNTSRLRMKPAVSGAAGRPHSADFAIPAGCPFQWVSIAIAGDATEGETLPWIDDVKLSRVGG